MGWALQDMLVLLWSVCDNWWVISLISSGYTLPAPVAGSVQ